jgi:dCMP deaminase
MPHPYWPAITPTQATPGTTGIGTTTDGRDRVAAQGDRRMGPSRPGWHEYFLGIAQAAAARSDCTRSKVGAVLVRERRVRSTGYNGAPSGMAGCGSCPRSRSDVVPLTNDYDVPGGSGQCVAIHAEVNAVLYAERADVIGSTVYVTREPCAGCVKTCRAAGVAAIVWSIEPPPVGADSAIVYQDLRRDCGSRR